VKHFEAVIGLEVHAQLLTESKIFCSSPNRFGESPNTMVGVVSTGLPGALPVLNKKAVELAIRAGIALDCKIRRKSLFARKNYFYPDLPKGYQISQFDQPICEDGFLKIRVDEQGVEKSIRIQRIHLEEDAGKLVHGFSGTEVNLNRAGVPLIEIVTHPDFSSPLEAGAYLRKLHGILLHAKVCDGNLERGNFRCDANVSVRPVGEAKLGTRTELKNINSFKFIEKAIEFEIARQIAVIEGGGKVVQETRGWDSAAGKTFTMRSKADAHDYRYFPDPDLPPLLIAESEVLRIQKEMPELPDRKIERYVKEQGLSQQDAEIFIENPKLEDFFSQVVSCGLPAKLVSNWILSELLREIRLRNHMETSSETSGENTSGNSGGNNAESEFRIPVSVVNFSELLLLIFKGTISGKIAKSIFTEMLDTGESPAKIVKSRGLEQVQDEVQIMNWVRQVVAASPQQVADYRLGKHKLMEYLVGQVMKLSKGKANPELANELMKRVIGEG